jgi:hypothetical protein
LEVSGKRCNDLVGAADASETWKNLFERESMLFGVLSCASVFDNYKGKAEAGALPGG